jgi:DNA (cytosine-5)-methyltransferase 1
MRTAVMFSGAAGTSVGAAQAGAEIVWAANHSRVCVDVHAANFPLARNVCQDLHLFNHAAMDRHDMLLASPVCRVNSAASRPARAKAAAAMLANDPKKARQGSSLAASHNAMRALPWAVLDALEVNRPRFFALENVPEWATDWELYPDFLRMLRRLGYKVTEQILNSERWGVAQARERLFVIGTLGKKSIRVRDPKHSTPTPMAECVDWNGGEWLDFNTCQWPKMRAQLERAHTMFGGRPCFINLVGHRPVYDANEPLRTATRQDQFRWVYRGKFRYPTAREAFSLMGFPANYVIPDHVAERRTIAWAMAGDAVCPPVMRGIVEKIRDAA